MACGCTCPACGARVVAKNNGDKREKHFSHQKDENCEYGYETSLHILAKQILGESKEMVLPEVYVTFGTSYKAPELLYSTKTITIDTVEIESYMGNIVPDVVVTSKGKKLLIEIYVTHKVSDEKIGKIKKQGIPILEIDLSKRRNIVGHDELKKLLLAETTEKQWLTNPRVEEIYGCFITHSERKPIINRGLAIHVDYCPINKRSWKGKSYANVIDDCIYCTFAIDTQMNEEDEDETYVVCTGKTRIAKVEDLALTQEQRNTKYHHLINGIPISKIEYS